MSTEVFVSLQLRLL